MIPYKEMPQPEDVIVISQWGDGNYFIEDKITGKCVRINSELYWDILKHAENIFKLVGENAPIAE